MVLVGTRTDGVANDNQQGVTTRCSRQSREQRRERIRIPHVYDPAKASEDPVADGDSPGEGAV